MHVAIYAIGGGIRHEHIARAMHDGFRRHGVLVTYHTRFRGVVGDIAVAYGWNHEPVFSAYRAAGRNYIYWDLGYWDRRPKRNKKDGYHRVAVNDWDTARSFIRGCPPDRFAASGIELQPWGSKGDQIIVAGMSGKAAGSHGFRPGQWEAIEVAYLRSITTRPVIERAKPTGDQKGIEPIADVLARSHMLITHHSNTAIDALIAGVPFHANKGVASLLSSLAFDIERPMILSHAARCGLMNDLAYHQWRPSEMRTGAAWDFIKCISPFM